MRRRYVTATHQPTWPVSLRSRNPRPKKKRQDRVLAALKELACPTTTEDRGIIGITGVGRKRYFRGAGRQPERPEIVKDACALARGADPPPDRSPIDAKIRLRRICTRGCVRTRATRSRAR